MSSGSRTVRQGSSIGVAKCFAIGLSGAKNLPNCQIPRLHGTWRELLRGMWSEDYFLFADNPYSGLYFSPRNH